MPEQLGEFFCKSGSNTTTTFVMVFCSNTFIDSHLHLTKEVFLCECGCGFVDEFTKGQKGYLLIYFLKFMLNYE